MYKEFERLRDKHPLYVLCSFIYPAVGGVLLGGTNLSYIISFAIYVLSVIIAFSPITEKMLRFLNGVRRIETNEEREYLTPIFAEVMNTIQQEKDEPNKKALRIELCIIDKLEVNACAMGRRTIAVTKGAMKAFDEEQLKGVIAHEVAHIKSGDTIAEMFLLIASGYFYLIISLFKLIILYMEKAASEVKEKSFDSYSYSLVRGIAEVLIFVITLLSQITMAVGSRKREYRADKTAHEWGFGEELISALYLLEKINLGDNRDFTQKLTASHPRVTKRIGRLESFYKAKNEI